MIFKLISSFILLSTVFTLGRAVQPTSACGIERLYGRATTSASFYLLNTVLLFNPHVPVIDEMSQSYMLYSLIR